MLRGMTWTELMWTSPPVAPPSDLNVFTHSVVFVFQTFTVPSLLALQQLYMSVLAFNKLP